MRSYLQKISLYWYFQIFGWGTVILYGSFYSKFDKLPFHFALFQLITPALISLWATHQYKLWSHRKKLLKLDILSLVPKLIVALIILSLIYVLSSFLILAIVFKTWITSALPGMITGGIRYMTIWLLAFHLYHYAKRESILAVEKSKLETQTIKAQLDALSAELNPHFLFNALNSIKALVYEDPDNANEGIVLLSNILRYSLHRNESSQSPLPEEIAITKDYLKLESLRLEERLTISWQIKIESDLVKIPTLSLLSMVLIKPSKEAR